MKQIKKDKKFAFTFPGQFYMPNPDDNPLLKGEKDKNDKVNKDAEKGKA